MGKSYTLPKETRARQQARARLFTFKRISLGFIGALCLGWFIVWLLRVVQNVGMPQIEYSESYMLYIAHLFGTGQWSWNIQQPDGGVMVSFYTPIFYIDPGPADECLWVFPHRGPCSGAFSLCWMQRHDLFNSQEFVKERIYAVIGAVLPLTQPYVNAWSLFRSG